MSATYFWDGKRVISYESEVSLGDDAAQEHLEMLCVDGFSQDPNQRYGKFIKMVGWGHKPLNDFPKEFRAHLLLLGVA